MSRLDDQNSNRSMMSSSYGDQKADKSKELNESMTIKETGQDEFEKTAHNIGGNN